MRGCRDTKCLSVNKHTDQSKWGGCQQWGSEGIVGILTFMGKKSCAQQRTDQNIPGIRLVFVRAFVCVLSLSEVSSMSEGKVWCPDRTLMSCRPVTRQCPAEGKPGCVET